MKNVWKIACLYWFYHHKLDKNITSFHHFLFHFLINNEIPFNLMFFRKITRVFSLFKSKGKSQKFNYKPPHTFFHIIIFFFCLANFIKTELILWYFFFFKCLHLIISISRLTQWFPKWKCVFRRATSGFTRVTSHSTVWRKKKVPAVYN